MLATACVALSGLTTARADGTPKTLFFHAEVPVSNVDESQGVDPTMDEIAPTSSQDKIALATAAIGNRGFRKNQFGAYWVGSFQGTIGGDPTVVFWARTAVAQRLDVRLFANGAAGVIAPLGIRTVAASPGEAEYTVVFDGVTAALEKGLVVQIWGATDPAQAAGQNANADALILFDSIQHPSRISFTLSPLAPPLPALDDPFGIAFAASGNLVTANAGTGHVLLVDGTTLRPVSVAASGIIPGGFARGVTGIAIDGAGKIYAAVAETGEVLVIPPGGAPAGTYARGLGTPIGLAFAGNGDLYVADRAGKRVVRVQQGTKKKRKLSVLATFAQGPYGLAFAPDGTLAVSTQVDGKIYSVNVATSAVTEIANLNDDDPATAFTDSAEGLAYDAAGNLYIGNGRRGRLVMRDPAGVVSEIASALGGPLHLAFRPGTGTLLVATQGEGRTAGDEILTTEIEGATGVALAAPAGLPGPLGPITRTWVHKAVAPDDAAVPVTGPARPIDPADYSGTLAEATARYTGENAIEPTIGIQTDGDLFMVESRNPCSITLVVVCGRSEYFRSPDEGITWQEITPDTDQGQEMPPVSADPLVHVDRTTNRVFANDLTSACTYMSYSDDDGATWTQNPVACGLPPVDHQTFVTAKPRTVETSGYPNVIVMCSNAIAVSPCQRSLDGGDNWEAAGPAYAAPPLLPTRCGVGLTSHVSADPDGRLFLPRVSTTAACVAISEDDGASWITYPVSTTVPGGPDHEGRIAADSAGNLYYVWASRDRLPYLTTSSDHGRTWSAPKMIAPPGVTTVNFPSIAAGKPGSIAISYMGTTVDYGYAARNFAKASWNAYVMVTTDALGNDPTLVTTTANSLLDPIKRGQCGPGRCDLVFDFLDVDIDEEGRPWATFGDMCYADCITNRTASTSSTFARGFVAPLTIGPNLVGDGDLPVMGGASLPTPPGSAITFGVFVKGGEVVVFPQALVAGSQPFEIGVGEVAEEGLEPVEEMCEGFEPCREQLQSILEGGNP